MTTSSAAGTVDAEAQLRTFIDKFAPKDQRLIRAVQVASGCRSPHRGRNRSGEDSAAAQRSR